MNVILSADEMKQCDKMTIDTLDIPAMVLMERAAMSISDVICERDGECRQVLIVAGKGNNGGDGLALGRLLAECGKQVTFYLPMGAASAEAVWQKKIIENSGFDICDKWPEKEYDIIIDALLGIGTAGNALHREYLTIVRKINDCRKNGTRIYAVDLPTGVHTDTGRIMKEAVRADVTVTFQYAKKAHLLYPGKEYCGEVIVKPVGIGDYGISSQTAFSYQQEDLNSLLPKRNPAGHKGSFGKVFLFAGSEEICGAAILCARAIMASGAGMVKVYTVSQNREILQTALPEAMIAFSMEEAVQWADVLVIGPGIGKKNFAYDTIMQLLEMEEKPMVVDADAINLLAEQSSLRDKFVQYCLNNKRRVVLTPHPMELIRLAETNMTQYQEDREQMLIEQTKRLHATIVSKDASTMVASEDSSCLYLNSTGNDGMATAGSGDVLTGLIGGLMAQGFDTFEAACKGVFLHGLAGDWAAKQRGAHGMIASDIIEGLQKYMD